VEEVSSSPLQEMTPNPGTKMLMLVHYVLDWPLQNNSKDDDENDSEDAEMMASTDLLFNLTW
jgi:hypothetical protein